MGGSHLPQLVEQRLADADPQNYLRQRAALELWGTPGTPVTLPDALYEAFGLPAPSLPANPLAPAPFSIPDRRPTEAHALDSRVSALRAWAAGRAPLDQVPAQYFRELAYEALESFIDWDADNLWQTVFARKTGGGTAFSARNIVFRNQVMNPPAGAPVLLHLPIRPDDEAALREVSIALEGLHEFREHGSWDFENGQLALQKLADCMEDWSAEVLSQIRRLQDRNGQWQPVRSAVELLAIGAAMAGRISSTDSYPDVLNALFTNWPDPGSMNSGSQEWLRVHRAVYQARSDLIRVLRARASATKGGRVGPLLDPSQLVPTLREIRRNWQIRWAGPEDTRGLFGSYQVVAEVHATVRSRLPGAARAELDRRLTWLKEVRTWVPAGTPRRDLVDGLKKLQGAAGAEAIAASAKLQAEFEVKLAEFETVQFDAAARAVELLQMAESPVEVLPQLGRAPANAVDVSRSFFELVERYLETLDGSLQAKLADLQRQAGGIDVAAEKARIERSLASNDDLLAEMGVTE